MNSMMADPNHLAEEEPDRRQQAVVVLLLHNLYWLQELTLPKARSRRDRLAQRPMQPNPSILRAWRARQGTVSILLAAATWED
jgi:hypothetical protein